MTVPATRDVVAQWAFDTRPLLLRFHLWLDDVQVEWRRGGPDKTHEHTDFAPGDIRRCLVMTAGVTALGTRLFASFGAGKGADKHALNQVTVNAPSVPVVVNVLAQPTSDPAAIKRHHKRLRSQVLPPRMY